MEKEHTRYSYNNFFNSNPIHAEMEDFLHIRHRFTGNYDNLSVIF